MGSAGRRARSSGKARKLPKTAGLAAVAVATLAVAGVAAAAFVASTAVGGGLSVASPAVAPPGVAAHESDRPAPVVEAIAAPEDLPSSPGAGALGADLRTDLPAGTGAGEEAPEEPAQEEPAPDPAEASPAAAGALPAAPGEEPSAAASDAPADMETSVETGPEPVGEVAGGDGGPLGGPLGNDPWSAASASFGETGETVAPSPEAAPPAAPADKTLSLTVPRLKRVSGVPVTNAAYDDRAALDAGALHPESTGFPWEPGANVYIAGHRIGYAGSGSFLVFYDLDELRPGDAVIVSDALGREYEYSVTGKRVIESDDTAVMEPVANKDVLTLQTCTLPDYTSRLIVRAEKVGP